MASVIYHSAIRGMANGSIDFDTDTFRVMLTTSSYTEDKDTHDFRNDVTNEVVGAGYTANGAVTSASISAIDAANDRVEITIGAASWATSTITARKAVVYKARGGASTADELICCIDFGSDVISTAGTFTLTASTIRFQN